MQPLANREPVPELCSRELIAVGQIWKRQGRTIVARFGGSSMRPAITSDDEVLLDCRQTNPLVGDVIARVFLDRVLVHRVTVSSPDQHWLLTRGDANIRPDPPLFDRSEIIGTVTSVVRDGIAMPVALPRHSMPATLLEHLCSLASRFGDGALMILVTAFWDPLEALRICVRVLLRRRSQMAGRL